MNLREKILGMPVTLEEMRAQRIKALNAEDTMRLVNLATQFNKGVDVIPEIKNGTLRVTFLMVRQKASELRKIK
jgi:hypothetical protein